MNFTSQQQMEIKAASDRLKRVLEVFATVQAPNMTWDPIVNFWMKETVRIVNIRPSFDILDDSKEPSFQLVLHFHAPRVMAMEDMELAQELLREVARIRDKVRIANAPAPEPLTPVGPYKETN